MVWVVFSLFMQCVVDLLRFMRFCGMNIIISMNSIFWQSSQVWVVFDVVQLKKFISVVFSVGLRKLLMLLMQLLSIMLVDMLVLNIMQLVDLLVSICKVLVMFENRFEIVKVEMFSWCMLQLRKCRWWLFLCRLSVSCLVGVWVWKCSSVSDISIQVSVR